MPQLEQRDLIVSALRTAAFPLQATVNWGACEKCDPSAEGVEIAGEALHKINQALEALGEPKAYV